MFTALHPLLLWGAAAVAVPILIHLLLRQRPRPRPWAAMRWLLAAAQAAQRRYRLTNLLLLLLRCLIVLLIALAIARPALPGFGGGERLVLVVDRSASMGARGDDPGPLASIKAALTQAELDYRTVVLVGVAQDVQQFSAGSPADFKNALGRLDVSELPGGLDRASSGALADQLTGFIGNSADVVLISDFQQDDAAQLLALLEPRCRSISRLVVGKQSANTVIAGVASIGDLRPQLPSEIVLKVDGDVSGVELATDDGAFLPITGARAAAGIVHVALPPLTVGEHLLRLRLADNGLVYDNLLELPVRVRQNVPVLAVSEHNDYLVSSLIADDAAFDRKVIQAPALATEPLPVGGLLALRTPIADGKRVADWVKSGGVLWAPLSLLQADQDLREIVSKFRIGEGDRNGGTYRTGQKDIDEVLGSHGRQFVPAIAIPPEAMPVLWAGDAPLIVRMPVGGGFVIIELVNIAPPGDESLRGRGTFPLWVNRLARRVTADLYTPTFWQAGQPAPSDVTLKRGAISANFKTGDAILLAPGAWKTSDNRSIVIVPSLHEGVLQQETPRGAVASLTEALPERPGSDWAFPLAIAALLAAIAEGLIAAWAGKAYGRRSDGDALKPGTTMYRAPTTSSGSAA